MKIELDEARWRIVSGLSIPGVIGEIELEEICLCYKWDNELKGHYFNENCKECGGSGVILTESGRKIIALVKKYMSVES